MFFHLHGANNVHGIDQYYTFYILCNLPQKLPTTFYTQGSQNNQYSNSRSNLEVVGANIPRSKHFLLASCGPQISYSWANAHWGLWVEPTRSWKVIRSFYPCQAFSYGHVELWYNFQLNMYHFPLPAFFPKKRQRCITWTLFWRNNVYKKWRYFNV